MRGQSTHGDTGTTGHGEGHAGLAGPEHTGTRKVPRGPPPPEAASLRSVGRARGRGLGPALEDTKPGGSRASNPGPPPRKAKAKATAAAARDSPWSRYHESVSVPLPVRPFLYPSSLGPQRPPPTGGTGTAPPSTLECPQVRDTPVRTLRDGAPRDPPLNPPQLPGLPGLPCPQRAPCPYSPPGLLCP